MKNKIKLGLIGGKDVVVKNVKLSFAYAKLTGIKLTRMLILFLIIAIVAISFTACDEDKGIPAKFRFRHQDDLPPSLSISRAAGTIEGTTYNTESYAELNTFYNTTLGGASSLVKSYTPASFKAFEPAIGVEISGVGREYLNENSGTTLIDFVEGTTITARNDIPEGINATGIIINYGYYSAAKTTFTIKGKFHEKHPWRTMYSGDSTFDYDPVSDTTVISIMTIVLFPNKAITSDTTKFSFVYTGTEYKYESSLTGDFSSALTGGFVTPWAGYNTTGKSSITFNVNWNTDNLISHYCTDEETAASLIYGEGHTDPFGTFHSAVESFRGLIGGTYTGGKCSEGTTCPYCVFVFADEFWKGFSFIVE